MSAESQVIVYDQSHGTYAARAWWLLNWLGHDRVAVLDGGFAAWTSKNQPVDNQWPAPKHGDFIFHLNPNLTVEIGEVASGKVKLIDSREYKRFTGETEPIDPVAGHIPGAQCIPYLNNTDEHGYWKSPQVLSKKFDDIDRNAVDSPVFYCGSGVTACHNILAYKLATGKNARLYPGSWSEWINYHPPAIGS
jgi:thiosulfate/3-mercaptopyruvate sulfurtransferase